MKWSGKVILFTLPSFAILLSGCPVPAEQNMARSTVLVYMAADNNLNHYAWADINEMESGYNELSDTHFIVYVDGSSDARPSYPLLMKIAADTSSDIASPVIHSWPEGDSARGSSLREAIERSVKHFPAHSYGLVLWSHGSAWLPRRYAPFVNSGKPGQKESGQTKTFGLDGSRRMDIIELSEALPVHFSFIAFDACYMSSVEVLYQLRDSADYFLAAPTEILWSGFPYERMLKHLSGSRRELALAAREFYNYYQDQKGVLQSASISLIDSRGLPALASQMRSIMPQVVNLAESQKKIIQQYTRTTSGYFYDLQSVVQKAAGSVPAGLEKAIEQTVVYKQHTKEFMQQLRLNNVSGLSMYIPDANNAALLNNYKKLDWYRDAASGSLGKEKS